LRLTAECGSVNGGNVVLLIVLLWLCVLFVYATCQDSSSLAATLLFFTSTYVLLLDPYAPVLAPVISREFSFLFRSFEQTADLR
jgi:hypothetical protein